MVNGFAHIPFYIVCNVRLPDLEYVVPVTVGTPPQVVNLDFDTVRVPCGFLFVLGQIHQ
jgi:hypothetical protein